MSVVQNRYSANGSNTIFTAEFEVFSESHIMVFLNDDEGQIVDKTAYDLINNAVVFKEAPADGTIVNLKIGTTPDDLFSPIVYYATASASADAAAISRDQAAVSASNAATSATNAANSATSASTSEANAATSETNASNSATSASTSAASAASSATSASNSVTIATTKASEASASATAAATSASNASTSESNAFTYMNDASSSASSAATYATQSSTSATDAANSATDAATSASNASASATSAATSETNAASSASSAATSEDNAATSEDNASSSATAAATSEANASSSATAAATSEANAAASATNASASATAANNSAISASNSALVSQGYADSINPSMLMNAKLPYSGYTQVSKKLDNFVFQTSSSFLNKVADKNRYVKFGDKVVDTYGEELVTNGDFSNGTTGWASQNATLAIENGSIKVYSNVSSASAVAAIQSVARTLGKKYLLSFSVIEGNVNASVEVRQSEGTRVYANLGAGNYSYIIGGATVDYQIFFRPSTVAVGNYVYFDNISVREIKTAQFQVPEVSEIITDGSNTTSVAVNGGDYVVDGNNRSIVPNVVGDNMIFPFGFTNVYGDSVYSTDEILPLTNTKVKAISEKVSSSSRIQKDTSIGINETITLSYYWKDLSTPPIALSGLVGFEIVSVSVIDSGNGWNRYIGVIKAIDVTQLIRLYISAGIGSGVYVPIGGMQVEYGEIASLLYPIDTIRAIQDAPIGTALTNTAYFEDRTEIGVTNQQLSYHAYNTLTNSYEGIKTETLFSDVSKEDLLDNPTWLARNGFSKVSDFLYSKGAYLVLPVGVVQC